MNKTKKMLELRRLLKGTDVDVSLVNPRLNTELIVKVDNITHIVPYDELLFLSLDEVAKINKNWFSNHWIEIVDFYSPNETINALTVDDIKLYLGINDYNFKDSDYYMSLLTSDIDTIKAELPTLNKVELKELQTYAVELYKGNLLTDYKIIQELEKVIPTLNFDEF